MTPAAAPEPNRDFVRVGRSPIDGAGLFAKRPIPRGTRIIEYTGDRVPIDAANLFGDGSSRTYRLALDEATAIDGAQNGNEARFVNHGCAPNCEIYVFEGGAYLYAIRAVLVGEELTFDYRLGSADPAANLAADPSAFPCHCGASTCRGSLLARRTHQETP